ncbi:MAG: ATP-binding protein [Candidatus Hydrogenedentota bacterium]|nr:MAG: ATP-binding protein [Candidatus Hydrogenedentota bacterium]
MQSYKPRQAESEILYKLSISPAVCILGPRQAGKSTLAKQITKQILNSPAILGEGKKGLLGAVPHPSPN